MGSLFSFFDLLVLDTHLLLDLLLDLGLLVTLKLLLFSLQLGLSSVLPHMGLLLLDLMSLVLGLGLV